MENWFNTAADSRQKSGVLSDYNQQIWLCFHDVIEVVKLPWLYIKCVNYAPNYSTGYSLLAMNHNALWYRH